MEFFMVLMYAFCRCSAPQSFNSAMPRKVGVRFLQTFTLARLDFPSDLFACLYACLYSSDSRADITMIIQMLEVYVMGIVKVMGEFNYIIIGFTTQIRVSVGKYW